MIPKFEKPLLL